MQNPLTRSALPLALAALLVIPGAASHAAEAPATRLLGQPTVSDSRIAFVYAGDIWTVDRNGGDPRRLTSDPADEAQPHFSPDGRWIAFEMFTGQNRDVFVMPAEGGTPTRLTWHPDDDRVTGWTADGSKVTFASRREVGNGRSYQLWEVPRTGGAPEKVMDAPYARGAMHGTRLAYMPFYPAYNGLYGGTSGWRQYRGGTSPSLHILDLAAGTDQTIPGDRVNDIEPSWDGDDLYFVSDREAGALNVYRWDAASGTPRRLTDEAPWDVRSADAHDGVVVYEAGGVLKELTTATGSIRTLPITLHADLPQTRPEWKDASQNIESVRLSPTGARALITARGDVFTVPVKDGSTRDLTRTDGRREYTALWSPDGSTIAYVVQDPDGQHLALIDQDGLGAERSLALDENFHQLLAWGGQRIAYSDNHLNLWVIDVDNGKRTRIATGSRRSAQQVAFSPDGRWLAYTLERPNFLSDLMLRDLDGGAEARLSDGMADVSTPRFSPDGKYLYFGASTNSGPQQVGLDLSSQEQNLRVSLYAVVLAADGASPLAPRTGDEPDAAAKEASRAKKKADDQDADTPAATRVDLDGIAARVTALPIAERNYTDLLVAKNGDLLFVDRVQPGASATPPGERADAADALMRYGFEKRELSKVADDVTSAEISADGSHLVTRNAAGMLQTAEIKDKIELKPLDLSGMRMHVDPRHEWAQIFEDAVRMQAGYFYDPALHGLDWKATAARYRALLPWVGRREDLNHLIVQLIAEVGVGHDRNSGGDVYKPTGDAPAGLLGADLHARDGKWQITRILDGGAWNPFVVAPLAKPGLDVKAGDFLLAVNGTALAGADNPWRALQGTVGVQTRLTVADDARGRNRRTIVVEPVANERSLRVWDWVETRRARVDAATDGRVAYVYLPNTATAGYRFFNRMFFAQVDRSGLIIDERSNGGGQAANYFIDVLKRPRLGGWKDRDGMTYGTPGGAIYGPKTMLIDQDAGSGGDFLPWAFRHEQVGTLVGTRTWGGLIGIAANPPFVDGGYMSVPFFRFFAPEGHWAVENQGVPPDIEVPVDPLAANRGEDVQLEAAIRNVMERLQQPHPPQVLDAPPMPTKLGM